MEHNAQQARDRKRSWNTMCNTSISSPIVHVTERQQHKIDIMRGSKSMNRKQRQVLGLSLALFALGSILLAACGSTPTGNGGGSENCGNGTVHTLSTTFQESCVNVAKGSNLQVVPVAQSLHILV